MIDSYGEIEEQLWLHGSTNKRSAACGLRHRYCLLHLTSGLLRCESLYRAELSDFLGITVPKRPTDIDRVYVMVTQIPEGKTNHGRVIYSRATRHNDVRLCCIGGLSFYLQYRFWVTGEFKAFTLMDWLDNKKWFDVKLLVDVYGRGFSDSMRNDSYGKILKQILSRLGLSCDKLLHLGRGLGAKLLELLYEEIEEIKRMGCWGMSIYDNSYSGKIPLGPITKLAGCSNLYQLVRGNVEVPDELLRETPMGAWCYDALEEVKESGATGHTTANQVLLFFCRLNRICIQDAAAMVVLHPERKVHCMYTMPCFLGTAFQVSQIFCC
jgi:hypothetical protein